MVFRRFSLGNCSEAEEAVVVIDVLRAFSTAAYAFAAGAAEIILVATIEEALALRLRHPGWFMVGEVVGD